MKKLLLLLCLITSIQVKSQITFGIGYTTIGPSYNIGYIKNHYKISTGVTAHFTSAQSPTILDLSFGRAFDLHSKLILTPSLGIGYIQKDIIIKEESIKINKFKPIINLEFGKTIFMGRIFINFSYCSTPYLGTGIRFFNPKNKKNDK